MLVDTPEEFRDSIRDFAAKLPKGRTDHAPLRHKHWIGNAHNPSKNGAALVPVKSTTLRLNLAPVSSFNLRRPLKSPAATVAAAFT